MQLDLLSPAYVGEDRITVQLSDPESKPTALRAVRLGISYEKTLPEGVSLPVEVLVQSPVPEGFEEKTFRKFAPESYSFVPLAAGPHLVLVREMFHNRWVGRLVVEVEGDRFSEGLR